MLINNVPWFFSKRLALWFLDGRKKKKEKKIIVLLMNPQKEGSRKRDN
jgi:hypothetical protein